VLRRFLGSLFHEGAGRNLILLGVVLGQREADLIQAVLASAKDLATSTASAVREVKTVIHRDDWALNARPLSS
jgi:hypothetical protein